MNGIIYCYTSPRGKQYIGQTTNESARKSAHGRCEGHGVFSAAVKKYGFKNMAYDVLHSNIKTIDELNRLEQYEIATRNTITPNGYNLDSGGKNCLHCEDTKRAIAAKAMGRKITEETRIKLSKSHIGKKNSEESKALTSKALRGLKRDDAFKAKMKAIRSTTEAKEATRKTHLGKKRSQETKDRIAKAIKIHWLSRKNTND